ncbi:MAG: hypothetical protein NVS1B10_08030 [Candidatus Saccharimonadales bacterium]
MDKQCTKCKIRKDRGEFYRQGRGVSAMCKSCFSAYNAYRQKENRRIKNLLAKELQ